MRGDGRMKYLRQFLIILLFSFLGEGLKALLPLPVPASIYGLVLLFAALELGIIKLSGRVLERFKADLCAGGCDHVCIHDCGYGDFGKSDTVCNSQKQKGIRK